MPSGQPLVLASTSAARRALLDRLRIPYEAVSPTCDEDAIRGVSAEDTARLRALAKAESVARERAGSVVIGSDQVVELEGELIGKPGSDAAAEAQLARLAGREHRRVPAVAMVGPAVLARSRTDRREVAREPELATTVHRMSMRSLDSAEIGRYVAADDPSGCAGSYKVESLGIALFERIEGDDWTAIVGLPLLALSAMLRRAGYALP